MAYKSILVHLRGHVRDAQTLAIAIDVARLFNAHLTAVFAPDQAALPMMASAIDPAAVAVIRLRIDHILKNRDNTQLMVQAAEQRSGWRIAWRPIIDDVMNGLISHARRADLIVLTQEDPSQRMMLDPSVVANVVLQCGHPVLIVPYAGEFPTCGESVLVAWSGTRESARAVSDSLPRSFDSLRC